MYRQKSRETREPCMEKRRSRQREYRCKEEGNPLQYLIVIVYVREAGPDWKYHDRHSLAGRLQRRFCLSVTISIQISREFPHQRRKQQILTFLNLRCEKREHEEISFCFDGIG